MAKGSKEDIVCSITVDSFGYGNTKVLENISLSFKREFTALVGANGSGKTTLLRLALGLIKSNAVVNRHNSKIGYVPQREFVSGLLPITVQEVVSTGLLPKRGNRSSKESIKELIGQSLESVGLADQGKKRYDSLSGGQQQRALIARAIVCSPDLLVLDEPTAGVDSHSQELFRQILLNQLEKNTAILLVSHELSAVSDIVDRIVVLRDSTLYLDGPPDQLAQRGVSLGVHSHDLPVWLEQ